MRRNTFLRLSIALNLLLLGGVGLTIYKLGGIRYVLYLIENKGTGLAAQKSHRHALFSVLPRKDSTIIMLGNSIFAGCEWAELLQNHFVINRGTVGDTSDDILERTDNVSNLKPRKVFLLIGVNDLLFNTPQYISDNIVKITQKIKQNSPETNVIVLSVLPIHQQLKTQYVQNKDILTLNLLLEIKLNHRTELGVRFLNIYHHFSYPNQNELRQELSKDGIHLNEKGYLILKELLKPIL
ncbi:MAG: hypothetical protein RL757_3076 [Bacteroidota bacterium]